MNAAVALDLGSTNFKTAYIEKGSELSLIKTVPAPPLTGDDLIKEGDGSAYLERATDLIRSSLSGLPQNIPVGIASQRSSFLLWDKRSGVPATPLISWQDRRADSWCASMRERSESLIRHTGLILSPHYTAPKLAVLFSEDPALKRAAESGGLLFGTLETYMLWHWTDKRQHQTDLSMAARTLMADPQRGEWSAELLHLFGIPLPILPSIESTWGREIPLMFGGIVQATIADQAAGIINVMRTTPDQLIINLGTGGFVSRPTGPEMILINRYLSGPFSRSPEGKKEFAIEGTINGIGTAMAEFNNRTVTLSDEEPHPDLFCIPDTTGLGSPYWRADISSRFSKDRRSLSEQDLKRAIMEGIIFRVRQIAEDICEPGLPSGILLSGGIAEEEFIRQGLASCLDRPVLVLKEKEATLSGAGLLALAGSIEGRPDCHKVLPANEGHYLRAKFHNWKEWMKKDILHI